MKWLALLWLALAGCHEWSTLSATYQTTDASNDALTDGSLALFRDDFEGFTSGQAWSVGAVHGAWNCISTGSGSVDIKTDGSKVMSLGTVAVTMSDTHTAKIRTEAMFGDFDATVRMRTAFQVRSPSPNPVEIASLQWHYSDDSHFYFLQLMSTGWKLGKIATDPQSGLQFERMLQQSATPTFPVGTWYTVRVVQTSSTISITVDGTPLVTLADQDSAYLTGYFAFAARDAEGHFDDIVVLPP